MSTQICSTGMYSSTKTQNLVQLPGIHGVRPERIANQRVVPVDYVRHPVSSHVSLPYEHGVLLGCSSNGFATVPIDGHGPLADRLSDSPQVFLE